MNETAVNGLDPGAAREFVLAARNIIQALADRAAALRAGKSAGARDYTTAELPRGEGFAWISDSELRDATQRMSEAIATEKWLDGVLFAIRALTKLGVL